MLPRLKFEQIYHTTRTSFRYGYSTQSYADEISLHFHPEMEILYIEKGSGYRMVGDFLEPFREGEVVCLPPNLPHCWIYNPESCGTDGKRTCLFVQFPAGLVEKGMGFFAEWEQAAHRLMQFQQGMRLTGETAQEVIRLLKAMNTDQEPEKLIRLFQLVQRVGSSTEIVPIGVQTHVSGQITRQMQRMQRVSRYVIEHYRKKITLPEIASYVNMSPTAFCVFFKEETGTTFNSFLNEYRIERVCNLLHNYPEKEISEVAWSCGFSDIPYFNRYFRKQKHMTPSAWKKSLP